MSEPSLECTAELRPSDLEHGTWIVVLKADEMPHVALLQSGVCFSLEHDGNHRYPARKLWRLVDSRRIPTVLCRLAPEAALPAAPFFEAYDSLEGEVNCFLPVRDQCAGWFPAARTCEYVFELVPLLDSAGKIARAAGLHLPGPGPRFVFPKYDQAQIRARIESVRRRAPENGS